ncbi:MAG: hypothetical protein A2143_05805 [Gallionellales bacterium RBG_16_57_15]|nr:MAG: hypothetical protein A2143_05805 [Gallionellales bacterium RBG_16_57_15]
MQILSSRFVFGDDFTLSRLFIDGAPFAGCPYILEDKVREVPGYDVDLWKIDGETAIPVGRYRVVIDMSTRFKKMMLHLLDVKGFAGIRVHSGNTSHDTEGCLITGSTCSEAEGEVYGSRKARDALFAAVDAALGRGEEVWWEVSGFPK